MNQHSSQSNLCESAALRIQTLLGKDREEMLLNGNPDSTSRDFGKKYKCDLVKAPRILSQMDHLPLQGYLLTKGKKQIGKRHVTTGEALKPLLITVDSMNECMEAMALSPTRVAPCKFKEHYLVSKRLKHISRQKSEGPKRLQVVSIPSSKKEETPRDPQLHDYRKFKEERHFHLDRVIKYLVD